MKIYPIQNFTKTVRKTLNSTLLVTAGLFVSNNITADKFERESSSSNATVENVSKQEIQSIDSVPSPLINIAGKEYLASVVVDISTNKLFHYNPQGILMDVYPVATGKPSTPTEIGLRMVMGVESYPYSSAPEVTKRRKSPWEYGPKVVLLSIIDPLTGNNLGYNGEFLHGTNQPSSIGNHASHGCVRMHNDAIKELSSQLKRGDYILIKK